MEGTRVTAIHKSRTSKKETLFERAEFERRQITGRCPYTA